MYNDKLYVSLKWGGLNRNLLSPGPHRAWTLIVLRPMEIMFRIFVGRGAGQAEMDDPGY